MPKYIDANKLKEWFDNQPPPDDYGVIAIKNIIDNQPAADVRENERGKWDNNKYGWYKCLKCGWEQRKSTLFCPSCGRIMAQATSHDAAACSDKLSRHKQICDGIHELYTCKNHDYGDSFGQSFRDHGILAGVIRIEDKFNRLRTLTGGSEQKVTDESIWDTLRDMANYAIMTLLEMEMNGDNDYKE